MDVLPNCVISSESKLTSYVITMNHSDPMLDSSPVRQDAAGIELLQLNGNDDELASTTFTHHWDGYDQLDLSNVFTGIDSGVASSSSGCKPWEVPMQSSQCGNVSQPTHDGSIDDQNWYITRVTNMEVPNYEICVDIEKTVSSSLKMKGKVLFVKRMHEILIKVLGAQGGHVVKVELRYMNGAHENTPVHACKNHSDGTDPYYSFHVPKLPLVEKVTGPGRHLILAIPVPNPPAEKGNFTFPLLFRCWRCCHVVNGKHQELIIKLCDQQNEVLHEARFDLRVYENITREYKIYCKKLDKGQEGKKRSGGMIKGPAVKKAKQEVEGGERMQAEEAGTPAAPSRLPPCQSGRIHGQVELDPAHQPIINDLIKALGGRASWIKGKEEVEGASSDPPCNTY